MALDVPRLNAEKVAMFMERDEALSQLAEVTRERDALKAGKWAGPWEAMPPTLRWARFGVVGVKAEAGPGDSGWWHWTDSGSQDRDESLDAAKAAADAHLLAAGWYLAPQPETRDARR